jgi:twitching motility protein PilT
MKVNGVMRRINEEKMMPQDTEKIIREIYEKALDRDIDQLLKTGDDDFSFAIPGLSRFRVSAYKQRGSLAAVIRVIAFRLPDYKQLRIPEQVMKLSELNKGLVLVTGPAGSGKSTTLACMIEEINETKEDHIITLEDPLEFLHQHKKSIVSQREVNMGNPSAAQKTSAPVEKIPTETGQGLSACQENPDGKMFL